MLPQIGKVDQKTFEKVIFPRLGKPDNTVLPGPRYGVDTAVIELPNNQVMVIAEDPTFGMPVLMPHFGWAIVHICASDVAVLGVKPRYMAICLMLLPNTADSVLEAIWQEVHQEREKLGTAIVGGHTGVYPGIAFPLNGGCTVIGLGSKDQITPPSNARTGDRVIITKGPAIEAAGILALQAEKTLVSKLGKGLVEKAQDYFLEMTVVKDAGIAAPHAHAMHDTTEGGLLNGAYEVAAVDGRITAVRGLPYAAGMPRWGASDHMARLVIEVRKYDPTINAGINFKCDALSTEIVQAYCSEKGVLFGWIDRTREPPEVAERDGSSMPWKIKQLVESYGGVPKLFYEGPGWGKEPLYVALGNSATEVASIAIEIARRYRQRITG